MTVAGTLLLVATALLVVASLRVRGLAGTFMALLLVAAAEVVLLTILLSLVYALQPGWMLLGQAAIAAAAALLWDRLGRPAYGLRSSIPSRARALSWGRRHPAAAGMAVVAALALALQLLMGIAVAPNNWDSMTYHLARVAYWLQFDSVLHFDNGTLRQLANPPNGEYLQGWTMLLSGSDRLVATVQWLALTGLAAGVAGMARNLRFGHPAALFAAALFVVLPQPILQASSTQNDLIVAFFVIAALHFGFRGVRDRSGVDLALFGVALGLAVGAKGTALLTVPLLGLVLALAAWRFKAPLGLLARGVGFAIAGVVLLGSFNYILNQDTYGDPLGGLPAYTERTTQLDQNAVRDWWTLADTTGFSMPWLDVGVRRPVNKALGPTRAPGGGYVLDTGVNEDTSAFGLLGVLAVLLFAGVLLWWRTAWDRRALAAAALGYLVLFAVVNEYNVWLGRLMIVGIALGAPLLALLYRWGWTRGLAVALALLSLLPCLVFNPSKQLFVEPGQPTVFGHDRLVQQTLLRPEMRAPLQELARRLPADAPIGLVHGEDTWDYSFFGEGLERRVVALDPAADLRAAMRDENLRGIVFANVDPPPGLGAEQLAPGYWLAPRPR
jgi:Dolichyl-phosphate-mannose-protein mannosyltransferase